VVNKEV